MSGLFGDPRSYSFGPPQDVNPAGLMSQAKEHLDRISKEIYVTPNPRPRNTADMIDKILEDKTVAEKIVQTLDEVLAVMGQLSARVEDLSAQVEEIGGRVEKALSSGSSLEDRLNALRGTVEELDELRGEEEESLTGLNPFREFMEISSRTQGKRTS